jgi:hypothetical protein
VVHSEARLARGWHVGVDIGQRQDYSAVCVARVVDRASPADGKDETVYEVDMLDRLALGVNYMDQAQTLCALLAGLRERSIRERGGSGASVEVANLPTRKVYADETGVGDGVLDALQRLLHLDRTTSDVELLRVRWVAGEQFKRKYERGAMRGSVGKE